MSTLIYECEQTLVRWKDGLDLFLTSKPQLSECFLCRKASWCTSLLKILINFNSFLWLLQVPINVHYSFFQCFFRFRLWVYHFQFSSDWFVASGLSPYNHIPSATTWSHTLHFLECYLSILVNHLMS